MTKEMSFKLVYGESVNYFSVGSIKPLGLDDFARKNLLLEFNGTKYDFSDPLLIPESGSHRFEIKHKLNLNTFHLVDGGWLPPTYCLEGGYILDRNVVSNFEHSNNPKSMAFNEWFNVVKASDEVKVSTLFSSIERNGESFPKYSEFLAAINSDHLTVRGFLPKINVLGFESVHVKSLYDFMCDLRCESNIEFLREAVPLIVNTPKHSERINIASKLFSLVKKQSLSYCQHLLILCLSCLYGGELKFQQFSRMIIKPNKNYTNKNALNCINDITFIEVILFIKKFFYLSVGGTTSDKALAMYWCALNPVVIREGDCFGFNFDFDNKLFPMAEVGDLEYLCDEFSKLQKGG